MPRATAYLLDTNILVHLIRGNPVGTAIESHFRLRGKLNHCLISVVTVGEMYALARRRRWGPSRQSELTRLLAQLVWVDINHPDILAAYGELDEFSKRAGHPIGQNDLWIAATAKASGATLLTTDADFDHLHPAHLARTRIDAKTGTPFP